MTMEGVMCNSQGGYNSFLAKNSPIWSCPMSYSALLSSIQFESESIKLSSYGSETKHLA